MSWMIHSFANGRSWIGSINTYMELEELLEKYNPNLQFIDCLEGNFFDWLMINEEYSQEMSNAIENALSDEKIDVVTEGYLFAMKEVLNGGNIIMG